MNATLNLAIVVAGPIVVVTSVALDPMAVDRDTGRTRRVACAAGASGRRSAPTASSAR